ncbi:hypothetical protein [Phaeobacter sp. CECT 5382]|uniref:hypothetical protein n=1 Tax=Phaeobacter sp. CECT 5382 TaxID=1712645 RepID=UPI00071E3652|nr:hypothetical protein [Phaeobacter sp. CECT 5382]
MAAYSVRQWIDADLFETEPIMSESVHFHEDCLKSYSMTQTQKPIVPTKEMTLYQRQRCGQRFKDLAIKGLNPLIKGTGWKRKSAWIFKVEGEWYLTAFITGGTTPNGMQNLLKVELGIKPMAVDPIHWRAQGLHDNLHKPPSFRSDAAWKVPALPMENHEKSDGLTDVEDASRMIFNTIIGMAETARREVASKPFSKVVADHQDADRYRALRWASLIAEGQNTLAIEEIVAHYGIDQAGDAADILAGYQNVIDGTDTIAHRRLVSDIYGNQKAEEPVLKLSQNPTTPKPSLSKYLLSRLNPLRK